METADMHAPVYEHSPDRPEPADVTRGANWFFWFALASVAASVVTYFGNNYLSIFNFGIAQYVSGTPMGWIHIETAPFQPLNALIINLGIASFFAAFGYFARHRSSWAFLIGFFLYIFDSLISIGLRDMWGFAFHMLVVFFIFKGLVATRRLHQGV